MMLWRKACTVRRYQRRKNGRGYSTSGYTDMAAELDVQPLSAKELEVLPEGERSKRRVKTYGGFAIQTADQATGVKADRLFYDGRWFECEVAEPWTGTPMAHYMGQFVQVAESEQRPAPANHQDGAGT